MQRALGTHQGGGRLQLSNKGNVKGRAGEGAPSTFAFCPWVSAQYLWISGDPVVICVAKISDFPQGRASNY
jgi:hypothetical protein